MGSLIRQGAGQGGHCRVCSWLKEPPTRPRGECAASLGGAASHWIEASVDWVNSTILAPTRLASAACASYCSSSRPLPLEWRGGGGETKEQRKPQKHPRPSPE